MERWTSRRSSPPRNRHNVLVLSLQKKQQDSVQDNGPSSPFGDPRERTGCSVHLLKASRIISRNLSWYLPTYCRCKLPRTSFFQSHYRHKRFLLKKDYSVLLNQLDGNLASDVSTRCSGRPQGNEKLVSRLVNL